MCQLSEAAVLPTIVATEESGLPRSVEKRGAWIGGTQNPKPYLLRVVISVGVGIAAARRQISVNPDDR
eukprot:COSAG01_NODE_2319_length_7913_cov_82.271052_2_plen_68_part_00